MTCNAENLAVTLSIPLLNGEILKFLAALPTSSSPFAESLRFKLFLSFSSVLILVLTLLSNCLLSNFIETTRSSIVVLIV